MMFVGSNENNISIHNTIIQIFNNFHEDPLYNRNNEIYTIQLNHCFFVGFMYLMSNDNNCNECPLDTVSLTDNQF